MNKVVNINLNGLVFSIDDTAYEQLKHYLDGLKAHFGSTVGASEIIQDIEARIAELLQARLTDKYTVVQLNDIEEVIAMMGNPVEIDGEEEDSSQKQRTGHNEPPPVKHLRRDSNHGMLGGVCAGLSNYFGIDVMIPRILFLIAFFMFGSGLLVYIIMWLAIPEASPAEMAATENQYGRRLFRNPDDKKLGGVCSGIAEYLSIDTVWLRLGFLIAFFCFGTGLLAYIILWIAIPEAKTSSEKLQMKGESIDVSNIEKEVRSALHRTQATVSKSPIGEVVRVFVKILSKLIGAAFLVVALVLIGVIVFLWNYSFADILDKLDINAYYSYFQYGFGLFVFSVAALILVMGIKFLFHTRIKIRILSVVLTACSFIGLGLMLYFGLQYRNSVRVKKSVKEEMVTFAASDTMYIKTHKLYDDDLDGDNISIRINKHTRSRTFKVGDMKDLVKVFYNTRLSVKPSPDNQAHFYLVKSARGENETMAAANARNVVFKSSITGNELRIDEGISVEGEPFKYQQVTARLKVPVGTIIKVDEGVMKMLNHNYESDFDMGETFKMTAQGLRCLDCIDTEDETDEDINIDWNVDDDDGEVNIKIRKDARNRSYITDSTGSIRYGRDVK